MSATSRKVARKALATVLGTTLVGVGLPTQSVLAYPPRSITTSPVVFVRSSGTQVKRQGIGQRKGFNRFRFEIMVYVIAASTLDGGPDPETVADALDDIEAGVRDTIILNPTNAAWTQLETLEQMTNIYRLPAIDTGGKPYDVEIIPVELEVYDT